MGLLSKLFGDHQNQPASSLQNEQNSSLQNDKTIFISGPEERNAYIYYQKGLKRVKNGEHFWLTVSPEPTVLVSELTGTEFDTRNGGYALLYDGQVVGAASYLDDLLKAIMDAGFAIQLDAVRDGWYAKGKIPNIVTYWPPHEDAKLHLKAQLLSDRVLPVETKLLVVNVRAEDDDVIPASKFSDITLKLIPTPKGSTAKPHIGFWRGETLLFDVDARSTYYGKLLPLIGKTMQATIEARDSMMDNGRYIHVECLPPLE